ncbi:MAG TPA: SpoIID/LytB domain-containing protein [Chloroflexota bacterium]|nr:SpoIID/LytB domain-containing protein [Chloroflexota bacterium]
MTESDRKSNKFSRRTLLRTAGLAGVAGLAMLPGAAAGSLALSSGTGFAGQAIDLATLQPVAGALVQADPGGARATTDQTGAYVLPVPPGTYTVRVAKDSLVGVIRLNQIVSSTGYAPLDLDLVPQNPTPDQQQVLYQRMVTQIQSPLPSRAALSAQALSIASSGLPSQIYVTNVPPNNSSQWIPLEDYVKGVVPNEVPPSWPAATLQAQSVAARSYGVAHFLAYGYICATTACQVYNPNNLWPSTNAAVDATAGQVMTVNGAVIFAFFFAECNGVTTRNSEDAIAYSGRNSDNQYICASAGWNYVSYCRARPCTWNGSSDLSTCGYYGHGVGMCQWGAAGQGNAHVAYTDILNSYYTGIEITGCTASNAAATLEPAQATQGGFKIYLPYVANNSCS